MIGPRFHDRLNEARRIAVEFLVTGLVLLGLVAFSGCQSPEEGRPRGGGAGGDGGNYRDKPIHALSKLDGTRPATAPVDEGTK